MIRNSSATPVVSEAERLESFGKRSPGISLICSQSVACPSSLPDRHQSLVKEVQMARPDGLMFKNQSTFRPIVL